MVSPWISTLTFLVLQFGTSLVFLQCLFTVLFWRSCCRSCYPLLVFVMCFMTLLFGSSSIVSPNCFLDFFMFLDLVFLNLSFLDVLDILPFDPRLLYKFAFFEKPVTCLDCLHLGPTNISCQPSKEMHSAENEFCKHTWRNSALRQEYVILKIRLMVSIKTRHVTRHWQGWETHR